MSEPKITCHRIPSHEQWPYPYRFDIEGVGTGFHGVGKTPAEALLNAAAAWLRFETAESREAPHDPMTEWQDISTAPKETDVLICFAHRERPPMVAGLFEDGWVTYDGALGIDVPERPTHWQPLPAPPA